jgi:acetyltransferase-like isoleucine patch superfamily enzyme
VTVADRDDHDGRPDEHSEPPASGDSSDRREQVDRHPRPHVGNSLGRWYEIRNPLRVAINYAVILLCRLSPSLKLKRVLLRRLGVTVGEGVAFGLESTPDVFWPELITVEDDAIIGYDATILCHEFLREEYRIGAVVIREGAMIGAGAIILPGVEVGKNAQVAANSLVTEDVPPETTVTGVPAKPEG